MCINFINTFHIFIYSFIRSCHTSRVFVNNFLQISAMDLLTTLILCTAIVGVFQLVSCDEGDGPIFQTKLGKIQGTIMTSDVGQDFFAFRGIPFAKPPVKELRFKNPQPLDEKWFGVWDATEDGAICIQYEMFINELMGDEDCLYLNVYTPKVKAQTFDTLLPVMVYIHGGGFFAGTGASSLIGPHRLMSKTGIVLVTINYRLGAFGFLTTMDENAPGNYGMLDQVMALKWVQDNISAFGGNPNQVTIFGDSAGAASVGFHVLSPLSKGLFHAVIAESGSVLSEWATPFDPSAVLNFSRQLAELLKCPTDCHQTMMKCLMRLPSLDIIFKTKQFNDARPDAITNVAFRPVVDQQSRVQNSFLPDTPKNLMASKRFNVVPIMAGVNKDEGVAFLGECLTVSKELGSQVHMEKLPDHLKSCLISLFKNEQQWQRTSQKIISFYVKNVNKKNITQAIKAVSDMVGDAFFIYQVDVLNELLANYDVPTFAYKLTYRGRLSKSDSLAKGMVSHSDELQYLFRCKYFDSTVQSREEDVQMSDIMTSLWTNFAKTKVPSLDGSFAEDPAFKWEPVTSKSYKYMELDLTPTMVEGHLSANYDLWKNIYLDQTRDEL